MLLGIGLSIIGVFMALTHPETTSGFIVGNGNDDYWFYTLAFFFSIALGIEAENNNNKYVWFIGVQSLFCGYVL